MFAEGYIRRNQRLLSAIQVMLDLLLIGAVFLAAYRLYQGPFAAMPQRYWLAMIFGLVFFYLIAISVGLYRSWRADQLNAQLARLLQVWFFAVVGLVMLAWAMKASDYFSRVVMGLWFVLTPLLLAFSRMLLRRVLGYMRRQGRNLRRIALVGTGKAAAAMLDEIRRNEWMGYRLTGHYSRDGKGLEPCGRSGDFSDLIRDVRDKAVDEVFIALPMAEEETISQLVAELSDCSLPVHVIPDLFTFNLMNARMMRIGSVPAISVFDSPHDDLSAVLKRTEDIILSLLIVLLVSPLLLLLATAVKLTSRGPVLFRQRRYGIGGEEITVWKFRSMTVCEDGDVVPQARKGDNRITRLGAFMRRTSLDELPQFINVLQGRMSIVGPRPHAVAHNELYRKDIQGYMLRHLVKPGITGWAQVNGWRGETDTREKMEKRVEYDLYYIRNWSVWLDLKIIALTVIKGFTGQNAY